MQKDSRINVALKNGVSLLHLFLLLYLYLSCICFSFQCGSTFRPTLSLFSLPLHLGLPTDTGEEEDE